MLFVAGLSHRTAPLAVRERVALPEEARDGALKSAAALGTGEALIVSTCNRVEVYLVISDGIASPDAKRSVADLLSAARRISTEELLPHLYVHAGEAALRHLFRVAASLDSMVVGEPQILGQVKDAYQEALSAGTIGSFLGRAFPRAFATAKRIRSETDIGRQSASVASAAVDLAGRIFGDLGGKQVLVVGAGAMGDLTARHLASAGAGPLWVTNRTFARAETLAREIGGRVQPWEALVERLGDVDIVLSSTGAAEPVLTRDMIRHAMRVRRGRWLCLIDIAVPRSIDPSAAEEENVYLYDIDALSEMVGDHLAERREEAAAGERIVDEEVARFSAAVRSLGVVPLIKALRERCLGVAHSEAARWANRFPDPALRREAEALAEAIVNKLLHSPLTALKRESESEALIEAARTLFNVKDETSEAAEPVVRSQGSQGGQ